MQPGRPKTAILYETFAEVSNWYKKGADICMTGHPSPLVAYALQNKGYARVDNLTWGMVGWKVDEWSFTCGGNKNCPNPGNNAGSFSPPDRPAGRAPALRPIGVDPGSNFPQARHRSSLVG